MLKRVWLIWELNSGPLTLTAPWVAPIAGGVQLRLTTTSSDRVPTDARLPMRPFDFKTIIDYSKDNRLFRK